MRDVDQRPSFQDTVRAGDAPWPVPSLYDDWSRAVLGRVAPRDEVLAAIEAHRARVSSLKDPFTVLGSRAAAEAKGERVLLFDERHMALSDRFSSAPKALVVPRAPALFPCDLDDEAMASLERTAGAVMEAFRRATGAEAPPRAWVNAPGALTVRQLHVHVIPSAAAADAATVYAEVERVLAGLLSEAT